MLNHITIMGRMVRDPELRRTGSGIAVTSFTLAVDRDFKASGANEKEVDFIDCVAWRQAGEFVSKYFTRGRMAVVSGRLQIMFTSAIPRATALPPVLRQLLLQTTAPLHIQHPTIRLQIFRCWRMTTPSCRFNRGEQP